MAVFWLLSTHLRPDGRHAGYAFEVPGCEDVASFRERLVSSGGFISGYRLELRQDPLSSAKLIVNRKEFGITPHAIHSIQIYEHNVVENAETREI